MTTLFSNKVQLFTGCALGKPSCSVKHYVQCQTLFMILENILGYIHKYCKKMDLVQNKCGHVRSNVH